MNIQSFEKYYHYQKDPSDSFDGHRHADFEANIVLSGELEITCGENIFTIKKGEMGLWWAGEFHRNKILSRDGTEFIVLHFYSSDDCDTAPLLFSLNEDDLYLINLIDKEVITDHKEIGIINKTAQYLLSALLERLNNRSIDIVMNRKISCEIYKNAVRFMSNNLHRDLSLSMIAKHCGVCLTILKNTFSQYANKGVKEYFIEMKIEHAKALLTKGEKIGNISNDLGFSSPSYFSQSFKRICGVSPKNFCKSIELRKI